MSSASQSALAPVSLDVDAFAPMAAASSAEAAALDESLASEAEPAGPDADAVAAALLEWSLEGPTADADDSVETTAGDDSDDDEEASVALAEALAL